MTRLSRVRRASRGTTGTVGSSVIVDRLEREDMAAVTQVAEWRRPDPAHVRRRSRSSPQRRRSLRPAVCDTLNESRVLLRIVEYELNNRILVQNKVDAITKQSMDEFSGYSRIIGSFMWFDKNKQSGIEDFM